MRKQACLLIAASCLAVAQPAVSPETVTLSHVIAHIGSHLREQPSYTCLLQTVRYRREPRAKQFERVDTVRLEVALAGDRELFAWPGDTHFSDTPINELVRGGAIGSGSFGMHTRELFLSKAIGFQPVADPPPGRLAWAFRVPQFLSGYRLLAGEAAGVSGYEGHFEADRESHDLLRLQLHAIDIPPQVPYASVELTVDYRKVAEVKSASVPASATLLMMDLAGRRFRNEITFSRCKEFRAESTLLVEEVSSKLVDRQSAASLMNPTQAKQQPPEPEPLRPGTPLPPGLTVTLRLQTALDFESAAAGDAVSAVVSEDVKSAGSVVLPRGTVFSGRLYRFTRDSADTWIISLRFHQYELGGRQHPFLAVLDSSDRKRRRMRDPGGGGIYPAQAPALDLVSEVLTEWERKNSAFYSSQSKLPRGFRTTWITQKAPG